MAVSEQKIIDLFMSRAGFSSRVVYGPGDDCAVLKYDSGHYQLFAVDQLVKDIHFKSETSAELIAAKLLKRNLSDIAAMGGNAESALISMAANFAEFADTEKWFNLFFDGLVEESEKWGIDICGGDISSSSAGLVLSLSISGTVEKDKLCLRSGALKGDKIFVSSFLGNSFKSNHHLNFTPRLSESRFLAGRYTNTVIDISDGLVKDLGRICKSSECGAELITENIPLRAGADLESALFEGEDYELLFAVSADKSAELLELWPFETELSLIGSFTESKNGIDYLQNGEQIDIKGRTFDHLNRE